MMKKRIPFLFLLGVLLLMGFKPFKDYAYSVKDRHCLVTQISSRIYDFNSFEVNAFDGLHKNDFKVINLNSAKVIFKNGKSQKGIKNDHGHCRFELYYQGNKIFEFGHFKRNNWYTLDYELSIHKTNGEIDPTLDIFGKRASSEDLFYKKM